MADNLGRRIRRLRREADLTQQELADKLGVSDAAVRSWESGRAKPRYMKLCEIAEIFGIETKDLLDDANPATAASSVALTWDEREMLDAYRTLSAEDRLALIGKVRELARGSRGGGVIMSLLPKGTRRPRGLNVAPRLVLPVEHVEPVDKEPVAALTAHVAEVGEEAVQSAVEEPRVAVALHIDAGDTLGMPLQGAELVRAGPCARRAVSVCQRDAEPRHIASVPRTVVARGLDAGRRKARGDDAGVQRLPQDAFDVLHDVAVATDLDENGARESRPYGIAISVGAAEPVLLPASNLVNVEHG